MHSIESKRFRAHGLNFEVENRNRRPGHPGGRTTSYSFTFWDAANRLCLLTNIYLTRVIGWKHYTITGRCFYTDSNLLIVTQIQYIQFGPRMSNPMFRNAWTQTPPSPKHDTNMGFTTVDFLFFFTWHYSFCYSVIRSISVFKLKV